MSRKKAEHVVFDGMRRLKKNIDIRGLNARVKKGHRLPGALSPLAKARTAGAPPGAPSRAR